METGEFPSQRPVTQSFDVFFDLHPNNGWENNRGAGDLRCHRAHYDVSVINFSPILWPQVQFSCTDIEVREWIFE